MAVTEHDHEPVRGLPGDLPAGERILWQGSPERRCFAHSALFTRWIAGYFAVLVVFALVFGSPLSALATAVAGLCAIALIQGFAALVARTTVYTITNRRIVLRIGVALPTCINLPLKLIGAADLRPQGRDVGDIALRLTGRHRIGYAVLWPHARPFRIGAPQPMLRAVPEAAEVADILAHACAAAMASQPAHVGEHSDGSGVANGPAARPARQASAAAPRETAVA
ncbi:photosynthetic complex assembly protein [Novosphingobium marinum]|uniref:YdbS-like PH domain-containing protein n=1 Tax=Novosphingobium marinum TaxID=1514948 RepID=A0A7Y9Y0F9_9SPHN|nr:photosynthetic complex putative assembly protein PuhB [Novosphingobium marinum]NYH96376.1 hypothetical protein [Novosphingobium marinum]GGC34735.1 photosynthetic complex assembly protein [Novosphingobium marinum]